MEAAMSFNAVDRPLAPRVLVVGAEPIVREWVQFKLGEQGFQIDQAVDLAAALRAIQREAPDAIIVDPDGYNGQRDTLVPALCASAPDAAVVVLSACTDGGAVNHAVRSGARGYLTKTSTTVDLAGTLRTVMQGVLTLDQSSLRSLVEPSAAPGEASVSTLSNQELRVLELVAEGLTNREIGAQLFLSPHTVKNYLRNAADKLDVASRLDAVLEASRRGLIELPPEAGRSRTARRHAAHTLYAFPNVWMVLSEYIPVLNEYVPALSLAS
jgi:two-component system, NarL family, response regulator DevR